MTDFLFSDCAHSHNLSELLEDDQLEAGGWSKSTPNWDETFVKAHWSFVFEDLPEAVDETVVDLSIGWLIHKSSSDDIEG